MRLLEILTQNFLGARNFQQDYKGIGENSFSGKLVNSQKNVVIRRVRKSDIYLSPCLKKYPG